MEPECTVEVGQVWEDTYVSTSKSRWLVRVTKLNEKSVRVEPCENDGWHALAGFEWQYRMELSHFARGRMVRVERRDGT